MGNASFRIGYLLSSAASPQRLHRDGGSNFRSAARWIRHYTRCLAPRRASDDALQAVLCAPAVQPLQCVVELLLRAADPKRIPNLSLDALCVIDTAHLTSRIQHARRARNTCALVQLERGFEIAIRSGDGGAKRDGIFERLAGALR